MKKIFLAILGPSGSGKTTYLTALMHFFYHTDDWIIHPDVRTSKFYQQNIVKMEQGEFPPATLEEKGLSLEVIQKDTNKKYLLQTRDFRGSDLREWLDGEEKSSRSHSMEEYFRQSEGYLFLISPDHLNQINPSKYQEELSLYERALERAYRFSMADGLPKPIAIGLTKVDSHPQVEENLDAFLQKYLSRLKKNLTFYAGPASSLIPLSSVGKNRVFLEETSPPKYVIKGEISPYQVEKPLFFLFEQIEKRRKKLQRKRWKKRALALMILLVLYGMVGIIWGLRIKGALEKETHPPYERAVTFFRIFPWQEPILSLKETARKRRHREVAPWILWAHKNQSLLPYSVWKKLQELKKNPFLGPEDRIEFTKLQGLCHQSAYKRALELEKSLAFHPESSSQVLSAFVKIRQNFPQFAPTLLEEKIALWKKKKGDLDYWQLKIRARAIQNPKKLLSLWQSHLKSHPCPYEVEIQKRISKIEESICLADLTKIEALGDPAHYFSQYQSYLKGSPRCSHHLDQVKKKLVALAEKGQRDLDNRLASLKELSQLGSILQKGALYLPFLSWDRRKTLQRRIWNSLKGRLNLNKIDYFIQTYPEELKIWGIWSKLGEEKFRRFFQQKTREYKIIQEKFSRGALSLGELEKIWDEVVRICWQNPTHKEAFRLLEQISQKRILAILEKFQGSTQKMEKGVLALESFGRKGKRLPKKVFFFFQKKFASLLEKGQQKFQDRMFRSIPIYWGRDLAKLKACQTGMDIFIHTYPQSPKSQLLQKDKKKLALYIQLETILQNQSLSKAQKIEKIQNQFSFVRSKSHPQLFFRIQQFYQDLKKAQLERLKRDFIDFQKKVLSLKKNSSLSELKKHLARAKKVEENLSNFLKFRKNGQVSQWLSLVRAKKETLVYLIFRLYWQKNQYQEVVKTLAQYRREFKGGKYWKECKAHYQRFSRILSKSTYKITIIEADLPESQYEAPDGYVVVKVAGKKMGTTNIIYDKWYPVWKETFSVQWKYGDSLEFWLYDSDPWIRGGDDLMGKYTITDPKFFEHWDPKKKIWRPYKKLKLTLTRSDSYKVYLWVKISYSK